MKKIQQWLKLEDEVFSVKIFLILIGIAYIFSVGVRYYWVAKFSVNPEALWNNHLMINTNDGYQWAQGAKDILENNKNANTFPATSSASVLTAFVAKVLPFDFESIILWLPAFLARCLLFL